MANHKYKRLRSRRGGCHYCKPHKIMGNSKGTTKPKYLLMQAVLCA